MGLFVPLALCISCFSFLLEFGFHEQLVDFQATSRSQSREFTQKPHLDATPLLPSSIVASYSLAILQSFAAPVMATFSSKGPNKIEAAILKADITAPGVSIIAAYSKAVGPTQQPINVRRIPFTIFRSHKKSSCYFPKFGQLSSSSAMGVVRRRHHHLSTLTAFTLLFFASASALTLSQLRGEFQQIEEPERGSGSGVLERVLTQKRLGGPGSSPPTCRSKCGMCSPCQPVHVPIQPGFSMPLEYYPEAWRCKCGNKLFTP